MLKEGCMYPFNDSDSHSLSNLLISKIRNEIEGLDNEKFLSSSRTEFEDYFQNKAYIDPIILNEQYFISQRSSVKLDVSHDFIRSSVYGEKIKVTGTCLEISMSFTGDKNLWSIRPSSFSLSGYPDITTKETEISFLISFPDDNASSEQIRREIESNVKSLVDASRSLKRDIDIHNSTVSKQVKLLLEKKYEKAMNATSTIDQLGIPIRRRDKPSIYTIPTVRRTSPVIKFPKPSIEKFAVEPTLDSIEYKHILEIIKSMSIVIERNPTAFYNLDEESIRTHFLIQLNGHYEGSATGETFNAVGKTDILIRAENRNVFIAECKFWRGEKSFSEAIDQILRYLSWRDSKCALIVFNRTKNTSTVKIKMHEIILGRKEYRKTIYFDKSGISQYVLIKESDSGKEITLSSLLFDLPRDNNKE